MVHKSLDRVRQYVAASLGEVDTSQHNLSWVTGECLPCAPAAASQQRGVARTLQ